MPKCFKCEKEIECAVRDASIVDQWGCPVDGSSFTGGGSFGSRIYDTLVDGISVQVILCDVCLVEGKKKRLLREIKHKRHMKGLEWEPKKSRKKSKK